ncbi:aminoacyl tRNA synthase complex-interacting multifunctional protein 2 isoform X1 [Paramormyrops kingsleyae]|uniref:Aminoacyl tRNA synthetase complex interacting multifunctional protein 2 n=1 Tax=Paramormyrops kingsleyae TaxID=1676925 RepID=A0A3B3T4J0_9TELE|nr:aminoacyl tRNA synthase complex-interacting multifunctional protein 2 isoform X1 [Paramormyrops kingsleyae]
MYKVKPISEANMDVDLPTCMYKLPNIHAQQTSCIEHAHQNGEVDPALKALESRQDEIMRRLYELKAAVDGLAKTVSSPDADLDATGLTHTPPGCAFTGPSDLNSLLGQDVGVLRDIVINANPTEPPFSLLVLHDMLCQRYRVLSSVHVHSSVSAVPPALLSCLGPSHPRSHKRQDFDFGFTLIWKDVPRVQMKFSVHSMCPVEGEGNVARFLYKLLVTPPSDPCQATLVDSWVDAALFQLAGGGADERAAMVKALNAALCRGAWLAGPELCLADVLCACGLLRSGGAPSAPSNVQKWLKSCENSGFFHCVLSLLH